MKQLEKILFPTDFSRCANQALSRAHSLAKQYGAELHMLHGIVLHEDDPHHPAHHFPDVNEIHARLKNSAEKQMDSTLTAYGDGIQVVKAQERGIAAAPVILDYAKENDIDLIVMGTHGRRGLGHLFLGSVAEEVVRLAPCSVMTIREQKEPTPFEAVRNILVPIDFSDHAKNALVYAKEIAATYGAKLQLLHVVEETVHPAFYTTGLTSIFQFIPDVKPKSKENMMGLLEEADGPVVPAEFHVIEGRAARDISKFAEENSSDLIVISTHGLTGIEHFLIGSVTEKVVRQANCPVLTVKAFGKSLIK